MDRHTLILRKKHTHTKYLRYAGLRFLLLSLLLAGFVTSVQAQPINGGITPRIIGGIDANPTAYPWATALLRSDITNVFNAQICGGTLIADRWVLTAAHCVDNLAAASEVDVAIGFADLNDINIVRTAVNAIFVHPDYSPTSQDNDLALLELATPSTNTPVLLADNPLTNTIIPGDLMRIIGWGTTNATTPTFLPMLQETDVPSFDFAACNTYYSNSLTSNMICAAGSAAGGQDTCQGDSGGPMLFSNPSDNMLYQTGITSFGEGCALPNVPGVYTRVGNYIGWINDATTYSFPSNYSFGYNGVGQPTTQTLMFTNYSSASVTVASTSLDDMTNFSIVTDSCTGMITASNSSCTISLQFQAVAAGTQLATLSIVLDGTNPTLTSALSGIGLAAISDASALDEMPARTWYSGGDASWLSASIANSIGGTAMSSGGIVDNQNSVILSYVTGPTTLSFRWKSSTEINYDFLNFYVDGVLVDAISGEQDWLQKDVIIPSGDHLVSWVYMKDSSASSLQDTVWLDNINTTGGGGGGDGGGGNDGTTDDEDQHDENEDHDEDEDEDHDEDENEDHDEDNGDNVAAPMPMI